MKASDKLNLMLGKEQAEEARAIVRNAEIVHPDEILGPMDAFVLPELDEEAAWSAMERLVDSYKKEVESRGGTLHLKIEAIH